MRLIYGLVLFFILACNSAYTQVTVNTDGSPPDPSAIFDVKSSNKGILLPRMTLNERDDIVNPAEGLFIFCTNCGLNGTGMLCLYTGGEWFTLSLCKIPAPTSSVHLLPLSTIVWNWNPVPGATGYKWGTTNSVSSAIDLGTDTSKTEMGITCDSLYTRYVWAYSECGYSVPLILTQSNSDCFTCGQVISINHTEGVVAPVDKSTTYATVTGISGDPDKCWITSNLGSSNQASAVSDATEASAGWYWQFNLAQGYKHDGANRSPITVWITSIIEYSNWLPETDPCAIELGNYWRIPTNSEYFNIDEVNGWANWNGPFGSDLKMHAAGNLNSSNGNVQVRGIAGFYWSSSQGLTSTGKNLYFLSSACTTTTGAKASGYSIRCIKE